jgi:hypothetical protein
LLVHPVIAESYASALGDAESGGSLDPDLPSAALEKGWSHSAMAARYQHLTGPIRDDIASRVGGLLWGPTHDPT